MTAVVTPREASIFACLADTVLAPRPPLPPVHETDTLSGFEAWMASGPGVNRLAVRAALLALEAGTRLTDGRRWRTLAPADRLAVLRRVERAGGRCAVEALRAVAAMSYYGDPEVSAVLGYTPGSILRGPRA
jgi:hypothetical protein